MIATRTTNGYQIGTRTFQITNSLKTSEGKTMVTIEGKKGAAYLGYLMDNGNVTTFHHC